MRNNHIKIIKHLSNTLQCTESDLIDHWLVHFVDEVNVHNFHWNLLSFRWYFLLIQFVFLTSFCTHKVGFSLQTNFDLLHKILTQISHNFIDLVNNFTSLQLKAWLFIKAWDFIKKLLRYFLTLYQRFFLNISQTHYFFF